MAKKKQAKPYYGEKTKKKIVEDYLSSSATMRELSELHGILGSNTVGDWVKKYGNLKPKKLSTMEKITPIQNGKDNRQKRQRNYEQHEISRLACDLDRVSCPKNTGPPIVHLIMKKGQKTWNFENY